MWPFVRREKPVLVARPSSRRRQRERLASRARLGLFALAGVAVVAGALASGGREARRRIVLTDMEEIRTGARRFRADAGRCPRDLDELAHPPGGGVPYMASAPRDPWGRAYHFRCPGRWDAEDVDLGSPGADAVWGGRDDITTDL
jgi:hypothetical protein